MLFDAAYALALGFAAPLLALRAARTGRYRKNVLAKLLGPPRVPNPDGQPVVWFHGVSVGEIHLLSTLVPAFRNRHPHLLPVVSSTTDTGLAEARNRFPDLTVIPWPLDFSWAVEAAFTAVNPSVVVLAESELWPNFLARAGRRGVPVAVVNARLSPRSAARYARAGGLAHRLFFRHVARIVCQSADYADRFRELGVPGQKLRVTGSIKYDGATGDRDSAKAVALRTLLGPGGPVWVAGSTHPPEEELVLAAFQQLRVTVPDLRLILVPRHPDRFEAVAKLVAAAGVPFARRSRTAGPFSQPILLLDTLGELGAAWANATVGYVGGSLDGRRGGQSMIEPAGFGVPAVFGPHVWNFRDAARRLLDAGGAVQIRTADELAPAVASLLLDEPRRGRIGDAARQLVQAQQGATQRTLDALDEFLPATAAI